MDADEPDKKAPIQEPTPEDEADKKKVKQADQHAGADAPKDDADAQKPDPKDTQRKIETFGTAGVAAAATAIFQTIPH